MALLERNPVTRPLLSLTTVGWVSFTGSPPLRQTFFQRSKLKEVSLVYFRLRGPHVVPFDAQRSSDAHNETGLLKNFTHDRGFGRLTLLDRPRRHLDSGELERKLIMREDEQLPVADDVADDLSNEPAFQALTHATFSGVIEAICSPARSSARSSS